MKLPSGSRLETGTPLKPSTPDRTEVVGRGTQMGELLRSIGPASDRHAQRYPQKSAGVMAEDLLLFRDKHARGLNCQAPLLPPCTTLSITARSEEDGLRLLLSRLENSTRRRPY